MGQIAGPRMRFPSQVHKEVNMMRRSLMLVIALGLATLGSSIDWPEGSDQAALIKALDGAKLTLLQGIAQVAKGTEVPVEAKYEMVRGKLMLSIYTSAKGFDTAAEDNSFNEYIGDVTTATWTPEKEVFADLKHIARSAQYHALLSMTDVSIPTIIQKASAQGTVVAVREKIRSGKPVFEVMVVQDNAIRPTLYELTTGEPIEENSLKPNGRKRRPMMMRYSCVACFAAIVTVSLAANRPVSQSPIPSLMQLEGKIRLGDVSGRIDHLAIDLARRRLFVAELGNNTVGVVDLNEQKVQHVIPGLKEPQGVGYVPSSDTLFVANAGDGSVRLFRGADYGAAGGIEPGDDADNIPVGTASHPVLIGHGNCAPSTLPSATN